MQRLELTSPLVLPAGLWTDMLAHLRAQLPREGCGLLAGAGGRPVQFFPCANAHPTPLTRYHVDDRDLLATIRAIDQNGWDLLAIFHSHPTSAAYPSATDIRGAYYPESLYMICSLQDPEHPVLRAFWIIDGQVQEHPVEVA